MMVAIRCGVRLFLWALCLNMGTYWLIPACWAQPDEGQPKRIPYQRVFIPADDLKSIGIEDYTPVDVKRLEDLLDRHTRNAADNGKGKTLDSQSSIELVSSFYVAKLVGADLLSERSRLGFSGLPRLGERVALRPWSLAVQPPTIAGVRTDTQALSNWIFDSTGAPRLVLAPNDPNGLPSNVQSDRLASLFGWSLKAAGDSSTNNLKFSMEIPKCANSCLILALPPQAVIEDCTTVVKRSEDWAAIAARLDDWSDFAKLPLEQSVVRVPESLWQIELGGITSLSFSIALSSNKTKEDLPSETQPYKHLIPSQKVEHFIEEDRIRTTCDATVVGSQKQWMRFRLAPGARLRRLAVNQQDVEWEVDDGWIRWRGGVGSGSARNDDVFVEFYSPLPEDKQSLFELPRIVLDGGYVMSGTEAVQSDPAWKLTHSECEPGRLPERLADAKLGLTGRIEYSWYATPPRHTIGLKHTVAERRSEFLTKLTNDSKRTTATVRIRLAFAEQDSNHIDLLVAPNWQVGTIQALDSKDPFSVQSRIDSNNATQLNLSWGRLQKNRIADIEMQLYRQVESNPNGMHRVTTPPLVQLGGWNRSDTFIVEDSAAFDFQLQDLLVDALVLEDTLPEWQKVYLPKNTRHYIFRSEPSNANAELSNASPFAFEWRETPNRLQATIKTDVDRFNAKSLVVRHEIELSLGADPNEVVSISLPFQSVYWRIKQDGKWLPIAPLPNSSALENRTSGLWNFESKSLGRECKLLAVVQRELAGATEVSLGLPRVTDANVLSHEVRCSNANIAIHSPHPNAYWHIDSLGNKFLELPTTDPPTDLVAWTIDSIASKSWLANESELHIAVDAMGSQRACLVLRMRGTMPKGYRIQIPDGWKGNSVICLHGDSQNAIPFRVDGNSLVLLPETNYSGTLEIQVEWTGPPLKKASALDAFGQSFTFEWPTFEPDGVSLSTQCVLWLPREMQLSRSRSMERSIKTRQNQWPLWNGTLSLGQWLMGTENAMRHQLPTRHLAAAYGIVPAWVSKHWHIALEKSSSAEGSTASRLDTVQESVEIMATGADRRWLALLFVITALITPRLLLSRYPIATAMAVFLIGCGFALPESFTHWIHAGLIGMCTGFGVFVIYRMLAKSPSADGSVEQRKSARWSVWDDREAERGSSISNSDRPRPNASVINNMRTLAVFFALSFCGESSFHPFAGQLWGQLSSPIDAQETQDPVHQVVIPMDQDGNMFGTTVYVPAEMLSTLDGKRATDRGTQRIAARYGLRVGTRGRVFNSADQIVMVYDFLVGEDLEPVRFPINVLQLQFPRFSLDGNELSIGPKLRNNGSEWVWTPDKAGRHTLQIVAQPVLKTNELDRNRESISQSVDIAILPIANALLEIETDPQNSVEVVTRGRVTDPAPGRFIAMLGAVDRLQCIFNTPIVKSSSFSNPLTNAPESNDAPVMNTELFLQGDVLQAKTIVDFPKGIATGQEIEIEADSQWIPIGTHWGDAEWIDTRSGSTLGRRRYLLEWKNASSNGVQVSSRDRQISVIWVPQPSSNSLNVLFAECRDRRTRRGTLRYARAFDANWSLSLDGINAWIPAIGSKDRLDWPEMTANPIATSLRIPSNGSFGGVLKHRQQTERSQARVTTKWVINANRESLTSVMELRGGGASNEPLVIELPSDFALSELYNENGPVRSLQSRVNNRLRVQVLADRKSLEASFLILQAKRLETKRSKRFGEESLWQDLPWIALSQSINADQKLEITAAENVVLRLEADPLMLVGKGLSTPLLNFEKSSSDSSANPMPFARYQIAPRDEPISGHLTVRLNTNVSPAEIEVIGEVSHSMFSRPSFILEGPLSLKDRLPSNSKAKAIPSPDPSKTWLQVPLPETVSELDQKSITTFARFVPKSDDIAYDLELMRNIRPIDRDLVCTVETDPSNTDAILQKPSVARAESDPANRDSLPIANWMMRIRNSHFQNTPSERFVLLESEFWAAEPTEGPFLERSLEWLVGGDAEVVSVAIDGVQVDFSKQGQNIHCLLAPAGLGAEVVVFSKHRVSVGSDGKSSIHAIELLHHHALDRGPTLLEYPDDELGPDPVTVFVSAGSVPSVPIAQEIGNIAQSCLEWVEQSTASLDDPQTLASSSDAVRWQRHWNQKAKRYLECWSTTPSISDRVSFKTAVERFQKQSEDPRMRSESRPKHTMTHAGLSVRNDSEPASQAGAKMLFLFSCLLILFSIHMLASVWPWLQKRPWWCLIGLGFFAWMVSGVYLPTLILCTMGLFVAADSYWILTARLRRNGTRGLRSL